MPGVGMQELCCLFCCPPLPSRIAAKLAFLPPNPPTYHLLKPQGATGLKQEVQQQSSDASSLNSGALESAKKSERCDDQAHLIPPPRPTAPPCSHQDGGGRKALANGDPLASHDAPVLKETVKNRGAHDGSNNNTTTKGGGGGSGPVALGKMLRSKTLFLTSRAGSRSADGGGPDAAFPSLGIHLSQRAEWQYSGRELDRLEACTAVTVRGHVIPCLMVRCGPPLPGSGLDRDVWPENSAEAPSIPDMMLGAGSSPFTSTTTTKGQEVSLDATRHPPSPAGSKSGGGGKKGHKLSPPRNKKDHDEAGSVMKSSRCRTRYAPTKYTLLFSHGNAVDLGQMSSFYLGLGSRLGCDVLGYDYTGYGASLTLKQAATRDKGGGQNATQHHHGRCRPSEADLYADAEAAWKALRIKFKVPHDRIILYGQSIGTVPTIHLAAKYDGTEPPAGVILHSPLTSGLRVAFPFVLPSTNPAPQERELPRGRRQSQTPGDSAPSQQRQQLSQQNFQSDFDSPRGVLGCLDAFATMDKVRLIIRSPTLVIHGTDDEVIDHSHGRAIHANLPRPVDPLWVRGAGHNDIELHTEFLVRLKKFIREELNTPL